MFIVSLCKSQSIKVKKKEEEGKCGIDCKEMDTLLFIHWVDSLILIDSLKGLKLFPEHKSSS